MVSYIHVLVFLGLCKHYHLARGAAEACGIDLDHERKTLLEGMVRNNCLTEDNDVFVVAYEDGEITFVNKESMRCTCIASSHLPECLCIALVKQVHPTDSAGRSQHVLANLKPALSLPREPNTTLVEAREKLNRILDCFDSGDIEQKKNQNEIVNNVNSLYTSVFGKFQKQTRKRKITKLHPYRPGTSAPKKSCDHTYSHDEGKKRSVVTCKKEDGSFKKNRGKGKKVRQSFAK